MEYIYAVINITRPLFQLAVRQPRGFTLNGFTPALDIKKILSSSIACDKTDRLNYTHFAEKQFSISAATIKKKKQKEGKEITIINFCILREKEEIKSLVYKIPIFFMKYNIVDKYVYREMYTR